MPGSSLNGSRRKQLTGAETGASFQEGRASVVTTAIALILVIVLAAEDIEEFSPFFFWNLFRFHNGLSFSKYLWEMFPALHPFSIRQ